MMRFRDCIFDLYGTLVDIHTDETRPRLWAEMAAWYGARGADYRPDELQTAYFSAVRRREREAELLCRGIPGACPEIRLEYVFQELFREKGTEITLEQAAEAGRRFRRLSTDHIRLYSGARELLKALRAGGQRVWLLSNAQRIFTIPELRALNIEGLFDGVYLSSDCGCKKPDRRFFQRLLMERGIAPKGAVMVGNDGACDIRGAQAVGLATIYIRSELSPAEPLPDAGYTLEKMDLEAVRAILTRD